MVKVYTICLDAYPETVDLTKLMENKGLVKSHLVCSGAFTCSTLTSMISGCIGSEIIDGGIGYNTLYKQEFYSWRKDYCIIERLINNRNDVLIHNHVPWFSKVIGGKELTDKEKNKHYRDHVVTDDGATVYPFGVSKVDPITKIEYSCTNPDITLNTFLKWNFPDEKEKFYTNEREFIMNLQKKKFNGLFLTDLCHWHEYVYYRSGQIKSGIDIQRDDALNDTIKWLDCWDFNEADSIFFIFADHSHRVCSYLDPPSNLTWVYYKDNVGGSKLNPIISSNDFYRLIEEKFGLMKLNKSLWISDPIGKFNPNRVYAVEDGRSVSVIKDRANAFGRSCIYDNLYLSVVKLTDSTLYPSGIYLMITMLQNKHTFTAYVYQELDQEYVDVFSVICENGLADRKVLKGKMTFELTPQILGKAKELYSLIQ